MPEAQTTPKQTDPAQPVSAAGKKNDTVRKKDWPTITIQSKDPQDPSHHPVGVNGKVWLIMRDVPAQVPPEVLEVLQHAVEIRLVRKPTLDPNEHLWEEKYIPRFAVNVQ